MQARIQSKDTSTNHKTENSSYHEPPIERSEGIILSEEVVGYLVAEKSPNSFSTDAGAPRKEEKPLICILVFTHRKLICVKVGSTHSLVEFFLYGPLAWLITKRVQKAHALRILESAKSLEELLVANDHFEIDYSYIEKLELNKKVLKIRVSWNPAYLDGEMRFAVLKECKGTDCHTIMRLALPQSPTETYKNALSEKKYEWNRPLRR
jgi:hypothetical protein